MSKRLIISGAIGATTLAALVGVAAFTVPKASATEGLTTPKAPVTLDRLVQAARNDLTLGIAQFRLFDEAQQIDLLPESSQAWSQVAPLVPLAAQVCALDPVRTDADGSYQGGAGNACSLAEATEAKWNDTDDQKGTRNPTHHDVAQALHNVAIGWNDIPGACVPDALIGSPDASDYNDSEIGFESCGLAAKGTGQPGWGPETPHPYSTAYSLYLLDQERANDQPCVYDANGRAKTTPCLDS
jgi:hypothetical protein